MHPGDIARRAVAFLGTVVVVFMAATSVAVAANEPGPGEQQAKDQAAEKVATHFCTATKLGTVLKPVGLADECMGRVRHLYADGPDGVTAGRVCETLLPGRILTAPRLQCTLMLKPAMTTGAALWKAAYASFNAAQNGFKIAKFIANPENGIQEMANETKDAAVSLANQMATDLVKSAPAFDANQGWFGRKYQQALVLGLIVLTLMTLWTIRDAAYKRNDEELVASLALRLPLAILVMFFAPAIGLIVSQAANGVAQAAVPTFAADLDLFIARLADASSTTAAMGSPIVGILAFGLMFIGVCLTIVALLMHTVALYLTGVAMAIVWGMYINPRWRPQVNRITAFWISTALAKPLLIFMLGVAFALGGNVKVGFGSLQEVLNIGLVALTLLMVGLTPLALLKFIPLLPSSTESMKPATGGGSVAGAMATGAVSTAMSRGNWGSQREKTTSHKQVQTRTASTTSGPGRQGPASGTAQPGTTRGAGPQPGQNKPGQNQPGPNGGQQPGTPGSPTDPSTVTGPATKAAGDQAQRAAAAAGKGVGGPIGAAAVNASVAGARRAKDRAKQTAEGTAPDIARQDGGEQR